MSWRSRIVGKLFVVCALLTSFTASIGCVSGDIRPSKPAGQESQRPYLGPYPVGVAVGLGAVRTTLKAVEVTDLEWPYRDPTSMAPEGRKWAYVEFAFDGPGASPVPGGGYFYPQFQLLVDGKITPAVTGQRGWGDSGPPGVGNETLSVQVPAYAKSVVLLSIPSFADTQTVGFRLW
jgi:hypothetical protein